MAREKKPWNYLYDFQTVESVRPSINKALLPVPLLSIPFNPEWNTKYQAARAGENASFLQLPVEVFENVVFHFSRVYSHFTFFFFPFILTCGSAPKFCSISACSDSRRPSCNFYFSSRCSLWSYPAAQLRCSSSYPVIQLPVPRCRGPTAESSCHKKKKNTLGLIPSHSPRW